MSRMRSLSFPKLTSAKKNSDDLFPYMASPYHFLPAHSRDSSGGSSASSPVTPTFSVRSHSRWPSSTSSLTTNPDSTANPTASKTTLDDLVEEPFERDELEFEDGADEPMCICDTPFCEHRQDTASSALDTQLPTPEWTPGDDYFSDGELPGGHIAKRRRSGVMSTDSLASRLSRHFPSISKRFPAPKPAASHLRSAPGSRSSSLRLSSTRSVTAPTMPEFRNTIISPYSPVTTSEGRRSISPPRKRSLSQATSMPVDIAQPLPQQDPVDRQQHTSTPLLPPMMAEYFEGSTEALRSPLQSPTVANSAAASIVNTPAGTPVLPGFPTPPLSAKASFASLGNRSAHMVQSTAEIPPLAIAEEREDPWAVKLGHANFHITPEPYFPKVCDAQSCKRLADDWEAARLEYMRQAARISEHYGITSQTYKLTEQKWAEIDAQWRANHENANAEAQASGESPFFQPLAETQLLSKMPSLNDPHQPSKFPTIDEKDIVGPMVRYAKIQHEQQPSTGGKKTTFLKLFTDPASLLGGRANLSMRR